MAVVVAGYNAAPAIDDSSIACPALPLSEVVDSPSLASASDAAVRENLAAVASEAAEDSEGVSVLRLHSVLSLEESAAIFPSCARQHWLCQESYRRNTCNICAHRGTEYRCSICDYDLCKQCYTKAKFQAQLGPCCNQLHLLKPDPKMRHLCDRCGVRGTAYRCPDGCDFDVCVGCYDNMSVTLRVPLRGLGKQRARSLNNFAYEDIELTTLCSDADSRTASASSMAVLWKEAWESESLRSRNEQLSSDSEDEAVESLERNLDVSAAFSSSSGLNTDPPSDRSSSRSPRLSTRSLISPGAPDEDPFFSDNLYMSKISELSNEERGEDHWISGWTAGLI